MLENDGMLRPRRQQTSGHLECQTPGTGDPNLADHRTVDGDGQPLRFQARWVNERYGDEFQKVIAVLALGLEVNLAAGAGHPPEFPFRTGPAVPHGGPAITVRSEPKRPHGDDIHWQSHPLKGIWFASIKPSGGPGTL